MRLPTLPFLLMLAFVATLIIGCGQVREPEFRAIENVRVSRFGLNETDLTLDLNYYNPNKSGLQLKNATGGVWIDSSFLGNFVMDSVVRIPAQADFRLPVKLKVDMRRILKNSILALFSKDVLLKIEGKARIGKAGFYINYPIRYEGRHNVEELLR